MEVATGKILLGLCRPNVRFTHVRERVEKLLSATWRSIYGWVTGDMSNNRLAPDLTQTNNGICLETLD